MYCLKIEVIVEVRLLHRTTCVDEVVHAHKTRSELERAAQGIDPLLLICVPTFCVFITSKCSTTITWGSSLLLTGASGLYLGEIANKVAAFAVVLRQDIEKEGLHVVVEGLVVEEQLGQQTQVLTVDCAHIPINLGWN